MQQSSYNAWGGGGGTSVLKVGWLRENVWPRFLMESAIVA